MRVLEEVQEKHFAVEQVCQKYGLHKSVYYKWLELLDENTAGAWLSQYRELLDGVVISGGEPTLQPGLAEFLARIKKEIGLDVKLDTNGSFPEVVEALLRRGLVDTVAVDYKVPAGPCSTSWKLKESWKGGERFSHPAGVGLLMANAIKL
ncbi:MAG: radical SAM protein [Clostridia bacterium]|nr:MAG: radical SAM protein [Clostridia bacterium]